MSSSLKQEALRARKGKFKQITIKCICKGEILTDLDYIHKVDNHKVKIWWQELCFNFTEVYLLPIGEDSKY